MKNYWNEPHPFLNQPGTLQSERYQDELDPKNSPIDGRSTKDILNFIQKFARYVVFYDERLQVSDWQGFFGESTPFLLASLQDWDLEELDRQFDSVMQLVQENPNPDLLFDVFHFVYYEIILPAHQNALAFQLSHPGTYQQVERTFLLPTLGDIRDFLAVHNEAKELFDLNGLDFGPLIHPRTWDVDQTDLLSTSSQIAQGKSSISGQVLFTLELLEEISEELFQSLFTLQQVLCGPGSISIKEAIFPPEEENKKAQQPHLGLLFTFLDLFERFQAEANTLTESHLQFFFQKVLQIKRRSPKPDQAHLVIEPQQNLDPFRLAKGTQLLAGKDANKKDILYGFDTSIVVDQAKLFKLKTLFSNRLPPLVSGDLHAQLIEGVYQAPDATKADGEQEPFPDPGASWPTLGAKNSKLLLPIPPDQIGDDGKPSKPKPYPNGRLGFVCASPELYLQGGVRNITLKFELDASRIPVFPFSLSNSPESPFLIELSGEEEWIIPEILNDPLGEFQQQLGNGEDTLKLSFSLKLGLDAPAVLPYNPEVLEEALSTSFPVLKVEINPNYKIHYQASDADCSCPLDRFVKGQEYPISIYSLFREATVKSMSLQVDVKGLKQLIVQSEENLQDVNALIYPFGQRPDVPDFSVINILTDPYKRLKDDGKEIPEGEDPNKVTGIKMPDFLSEREGSRLYLGSGEALFKNWTELQVNSTWKDIPTQFSDHYAAYVRGGLQAHYFEIKADYLLDGAWVKKGQGHIFPFKEDDLNASRTEVTWKFTPEGYIDPIEPEGDPEPDEGSLTFEVQQALPLPENIQPELTEYTADALHGFIRLTLTQQDFLHKDYSFVLARQLMALGRYPENDFLPGAIIDGEGDDSFPAIFGLDFLKDIFKIPPQASIENILTQESVNNVINPVIEILIQKGKKDEIKLSELRAFFENEDVLLQLQETLDKLGIELPDKEDDGGDLILLNSEDDEDIQGENSSPEDTRIEKLGLFGSNKIQQVLIPNEPYTPTIEGISLDYTATADRSRIDFLHLLPFDQNHRVIEAGEESTLFYDLSDEGSLYVGLENYTPGNTLHLFFQLAEATSDTESLPADLEWYYLKGNEWIALFEGSHILEDETQSFTRSGIVTLTIPNDASSTNSTILPDRSADAPEEIIWIKVNAQENVASLSEAIAVFPQAVKATRILLPTSDTSTLDTGLEIGSISKLQTPDARVKGLLQPAQSFGGRLAESSQNRPYFKRVSEHLRHKGRGIGRFDYEHLILEKFPEILAVKCINHSLGLSAHDFAKDAEWAPGFLTLAVIPNLDILEVGDSIAPKVPLSLLREMEQYLKERISPFVRLKVVNPRYEALDLCINIQYSPGQGGVFFQNQLREGLQTQLAPWIAGDFQALAFSRVVAPSQLVQFIEEQSYVSHILSFTLNAERTICPGESTQNQGPESNSSGEEESENLPKVGVSFKEISGLTARSILTSGKISFEEKTDKQNP